ncbi:MAG: GNAT family N-acetyltransferase [Lysobacter sp.]
MSPTFHFRVESIDYASGLADLRAVRETVFVHEQGVPLALEWDELDPSCHHVIARDANGNPIGTGRLTPDRSIGRMAVLPQWRGRGIGDALLRALVDQGRRLGWHELSLHAQVRAIGFYARHGFLPRGERFQEAGIEHQDMHTLLDATNPVGFRAAAITATLGVIGRARRNLYVYSRELDPGLLDAPEVLEALRRFAVDQGTTHILLHDPATPQRTLSPLITLAQRLPSVFAFRAVEEPGDQSYPSAFLANDRGGYYFRPLAARLEGETRLDVPARARQLKSTFEAVWERSRPCVEYRALGI